MREQVADLNIGTCEWTPDNFDVRLRLHGWDHERLVNRANHVTTQRPWNGEITQINRWKLYDGEDGLWKLYESNTDDGLWLSITGDEIIVYGSYSHEDPFDDLDGAIIPNKLSTADFLKIADAIRHLIS